VAEFRPDAYLSMISPELAAGGTTDKVDIFSRFLWAKNRRASAFNQK